MMMRAEGTGFCDWGDGRGDGAARAPRSRSRSRMKGAWKR